jgi:hypothetical protein
MLFFSNLTVAEIVGLLMAAVDLATVGGLFAALDVTAQDPFAAMERLGLRLLEN